MVHCFLAFFCLNITQYSCCRLPKEHTLRLKVFWAAWSKSYRSTCSSCRHLKHNNKIALTKSAMRHIINSHSWRNSLLTNIHRISFDFVDWSWKNQLNDRVIVPLKIERTLAEWSLKMLGLLKRTFVDITEVPEMCNHFQVVNTD